MVKYFCPKVINYFVCNKKSITFTAMKVRKSVMLSRETVAIVNEYAKPRKKRTIKKRLNFSSALDEIVLKTKTK